MKTKIINAYILKPDFEIQRGELTIENGEITAVDFDLRQNREKEVDCKIINAKGNLIMPSFKNCHTHSAMTLLRGLAEDLPLLRWLTESVFPFEERLTHEDVYWGTQLAFLEYLQNGITAISDMYLFQNAVIEAAQATGFKVTQIGSVADIDGHADERIEALEQFYVEGNAKNSPYVKVMMGMHAEYTVSDYLLNRLVELSQKYQAPVFTHVSESAEEVSQCLIKHGVTPLKRLTDAGLFEFGGGAYHFVYPKNDDIDILLQKNIAVITNPCSNLKLSSGIAPIQQYIDSGITVALGTDGAASNNALDMFREMYLLSVLQKLNNGASAMPINTVLKIILDNCANISQNPRSKQIAVGQRADLIMLDLNAPNLNPKNDLKANIIYSANPKNILMTMIEGRVLYQNGRFYTPHTPKEIYSNCNRIIKRITN